MLRTREEARRSVSLKRTANRLLEKERPALQSFI